MWYHRIDDRERFSVAKVKAKERKMDKQFLDLEITLLTMEGYSIPQISRILEIDIEDVISNVKSGRDSEEFDWSA